MEGEELRTASSLRFIFTKKNKEVRVVDIKKNQEDNENTIGKKPPGRRQLTNTIRKTAANDEAQKRLKMEWGRAYKFTVEGKEPIYDIFHKISLVGECSSDPFYLKIFREMAYGSFPKGIFYDSNRGTMVCTEPPNKRNHATRKKKLEKYIRVCLPSRPIFDSDKTTIQTKDTTNFETIDMIDVPETIDANDQENYFRKVVKFIHRSYQRLELPIVVLNTNFNLSLDKIYQEIKLFIYMTIDVLSPKDSILLQEDSYQSIQTGELLSSLRPNKVWKKLNKIEQISLLCQYCKKEICSLENVPSISYLDSSQQRNLRNIEDQIVGLYQTGLIESKHVVFDGCLIEKIEGVKINPKSGITVHIRREERVDDNNIYIAPVPIQEYKVVDLQKISNSIVKQGSKYSKMVQDLTGVLDDEDY